MENVTSKKKEIENKLAQEQANIAWLKESLQKSDNLANNMINILTSFEERLSNLEDKILPVHKETTDLQRRQANVEKTLVLLDEVLNYHSVATNLKPSIEEGPTGKLSAYLKHMEEIDDAISFFEKTNADSMQLGVLKSLNEKAKESLQKEFLLLLQMNSRPVPVVIIQDLLNSLMHQNDTSSQISADGANIQHFPEAVMQQLSTIANWLVDHRKTTDFMSMYSQVRSNILIQSIQGIKYEGFKFNFDVDQEKKKPTLKRGISDVVYAKKKLVARKSTKQVIETLYGHKRQPSSVETAIIDDDEETDIGKVQTFVTCTGAILKLMQSEKELMENIIPPERQIPIFSQLVMEVLTQMYQDAEVICNLAKEKQTKIDHTAIQLLLPALRYSLSVKTDFDSLLKLVNVDARKKFLDTLSSLKQTGSQILKYFVERLKESDKHMSMPKTGTVHEITSNVMVFLEEIANNLNTAAFLDLEAEGSTKGVNGNERKVSDFIVRVLTVLSLNLTNKSKSYDNSALQAIFMLNNYNYIIKSLEKLGIMKILETNGHPNLKADYNEAIEEEIKSYLQSWRRVSVHLDADPSLQNIDSKTHLKDKHKQLIKDKFKGFNTDFDDMSNVHKQFTVPDVELKQLLYVRVGDLIVPYYREFLRRYRDVHFTKNNEKYVKYDVDKVRSKIARIYGVEEIVLTVE